MRLIAVLFSVLFFALSPNANAKAKHKKPAYNQNYMLDMQRYIFTWDQIAKLSPDNQVKYYRFLVGFLGTLEEMQPYPGPKGYNQKKTAMIDALRNIIKIIQPEAMAAGGYKEVNDASMVGKTCIYGGSASTYIEFDTSAGKRYWCAPQGQGSCPDANHTDCGATSAELFRLPAPNGTGGVLCVPTFPENQTGSSPGLTHRCVIEFEKRMGGRFSDVVKEGLAKAANNKKAKAEWDAYVQRMKQAVSNMEQQNFGGVSVRDYCKPDANGKYNAMNFGKQDEECRALVKLFDDINANQGIVVAPPVVKQQVVVKNDSSLYVKCHNDQTHPELGELSCLNCAVRELGPQMGSQGDASKWITMLAMTANPGNKLQKNKAGDNLKNRVLKMLLTTSYCTDSEFPNDPSFNAGQASGFPKSIYKNYGMSSRNDLENLLGDLSNADGQGFPWNFEGLNIFYRRARYGYDFAKAGGHSHYSGNLKSCLRSASNRLQNHPAFNYCAANDIELNEPTRHGPSSTNSTDLSALISFCQKMASACDGTDKSICDKDNLIRTVSELNEKDSRTKGEYDKKGITPKFGYYSKNFEMPGNQARCPRRTPGGTTDGSTSPGAAASSPSASGAGNGPSPGTASGNK